MNFVLENQSYWGWDGLNMLAMHEEGLDSIIDTTVALEKQQEQVTLKDSARVVSKPKPIN